MVFVQLSLVVWFVRWVFVCVSALVLASENSVVFLVFATCECSLGQIVARRSRGARENIELVESSVFEGTSIFWIVFLFKSRVPEVQLVAAVANVVSHGLFWDGRTSVEQKKNVCFWLCGSENTFQRYVLPIGVFVYRFTEWWNSPDNEALRGPKQTIKVQRRVCFRTLRTKKKIDSSSSSDGAGRGGASERWAHLSDLSDAAQQRGGLSGRLCVLLCVSVRARERPRRRSRVWNSLQGGADHKTVLT